MKDRLIELLKEADKYASGVCTDYDEAQEVCAEYILANGVIVPPFELGSRKRLYYPIKGTDTILETKVFGIGVDENGDVIFNPTEYPEKVIEMRGVEIGKTVFLTKEEAEKELERGQK